MASRRQTAVMPSGFGDFVRRRLVDLIGLALIAAAAALALTLLTYDPSDPSLNTARGGGGINNLLDYPGAVAADLALQTLGLAAALAVPVLGAWGVRLLRKQGVPLSLIHI